MNRKKAGQDPQPLRIGVITPDLLLVDALRMAVTEYRAGIVPSLPHDSQGIDAIKRSRPNIGVFDMASRNGVLKLGDLPRAFPGAGLVLVDDQPDGEVIREGLSLGALGFTSKAEGLREIMAAVLDAAKGAIHLSRLCSLALTRTAPHSPHQGDLTPREYQVLNWIARGLTMKETAADLGISVRTAECHRARIKHKLGIHRTADLVRYALQSDQQSQESRYRTSR